MFHKIIHMKKFLLISIIAALAFTSCRKEENGFDVFIIKEGKRHTSRRLIPCHDYISVTFKFDSSAVYDGDEGWNELFGLADDIGSQLKNSARFSWRYRNEQLEVGYVIYEKGNIKTGLLDTLQIGQEYKAAVYVNEKYNFFINENLYQLDKEFNFGRVNYFLFPYCKEPAPHDIKILMRLDF